MLRDYLSLIACLMLFGCAEPTGLVPHSITVQTDRTEYLPVQMIVVTTLNQSGLVIYDDHCGGETQGFEFLQRWNGSYGEGRMCMDSWSSLANPGVAIPSGTLHSDTFYVNNQSYTGTWRVNLALRNSKGELLPESLRISNAFRVLGNWTP